MQSALLIGRCVLIFALYRYIQCQPPWSYMSERSTMDMRWTVTKCISSCDDVPNGYYHSCHGCQLYATCSNGELYDLRPCPLMLQWDDATKRCEWRSSTCRRQVIRRVKTCVDDCRGVRNGDYQSCNGCDVYVTCSNGAIYANRPCPAMLLWDDNAKRCNWSSWTCTYDRDD